MISHGDAAADDDDDDYYYYCGGGGGRGKCELALMFMLMMMTMMLRAVDIGEMQAIVTVTTPSNCWLYPSCQGRSHKNTCTLVN